MRSFTKALNFLVCLAASIGFIWYTFGKESYLERVTPILGDDVYGKLLILGAVAVFLLNIYSIYRYFQIARHRQRAIEIEGKNGFSSVSIDAIQSLLLAELARVSDITHPRVSLSTSGKGKSIKCDLEISLKRSRDLTGRADEVKQIVRDAFRSMLPSGPGIEISVSIVDLTPLKESDHKPAEQFSGPVYPNNEESANEG